MKIFLGDYKTKITKSQKKQIKNILNRKLKKSKKIINKRFKYIKIDDVDCRGLDYTLALIIYKSLKHYKKIERDSYPIDFCDSSRINNQLTFPFYEESYDQQLEIDQWEKVVDQMIYAFHSLAYKDKIDNKFFSNEQEYDSEHYSEYFKNMKFDKIAYENHYIKIQEGLEFFAKFFQNL